MATDRSERTSRSPRGEGHLLRDEIVRQTAALLRQADDADNVSVRAIADAVDRTVPALYRHFDDRDEMIAAAALRELDAMGVAVARDIEDVHDLDVRLRRRAAGYVAFATDNPAAYRALFMTPAESPNVPDTVDALMRTVGFDGLVVDVGAAQEQGLMDATVSPRSIALQLWTTVHGVASLLIAHPHLDWPDDLLDRTLDMNAIGLIPR